MGNHLINGKFQSDKYPTCPAGKVPLSTKDPMAQDLLAEYARRRREVDAEFSADLEKALRLDGYKPVEIRDRVTRLEAELFRVQARLEKLEDTFDNHVHNTGAKPYRAGY